MLRNSGNRLMIVSLFVIATFAFASSMSQATQKKNEAAQASATLIWADPGEVENLDFAGGPGGRAGEPKPPFTFVKESLSGSNPKVHVNDANGVKWVVKFGSEINAETFASRVAWAAGYFVELNYFIPIGKVENLGNLTRAKKYFNPDGSFIGARFETRPGKDVKKLDGKRSWGWLQNPFAGSKELNGLKVIMMLTSNFDNKDVRDVKRGSNTAIFLVPTENGIENRYLVSDWGGSMGKWGGFISREKWDCKGFSSQTKGFIKGVEGDFVEFGFSGQHTGSFKNDIRVSDVKWLLQYVGRITDDQFRNGLRASGATPDEVECFTQAMRERIDQMKRIVGD